jgi:hypothetical protein
MGLYRGKPMRKYFIASVVAVLAFAFAAFAASLNVDGGVLASGQDNTLTCGNDAVVDNVEVSYATSNDTTGHWIDAIHLQFPVSCAGSYAIVNGFGPLVNTQILSLVSANTIDGTGKVVLDIFDGATRVADLINIQVMVKDELVVGTYEYPGFEASGNPIVIRSTNP